ncbi:MAG: response regulator [Clostridiales bacterium]|nr:response regulator [Clostridiales bacterium]
MIMLVENNDDDMRNLKICVAECYPDSDIIAFSDPAEALEFIRSDKAVVDLCFTEVVMRGVTGFRLVSALRERNKASKVVFLADTSDYAIDAWRYNANDYLLKPVTLKSVEHTLSSVSHAP